MDLITWLKENDERIDWQLFAGPWDQMQSRHNPFRNEQIEAIVEAARLTGHRPHVVLDVGCGPGILGRRILSGRPETHYYAADADPLMLAAVQRLLPSPKVHPLLTDLRTHGWALQYQDTFDAVVSLTALHWLTKRQLEHLYRAIWSVLKPEGKLVVGDPYLPDSLSDRARLADLQNSQVSSQEGATWNEFWTAFIDRYHAKEIYSAYHDTRIGDELFQGSDDGYPVSFYLDGLTRAGYVQSKVHWTKGLRIVYGGTKPRPTE